MAVVAGAVLRSVQESDGRSLSLRSSSVFEVALIYMEAEEAVGPVVDCLLLVPGSITTGREA